MQLPSFYSRLLRAVELSPQGRATGAQWKATIKNAKVGINLEEFSLPHVQDRDNDTTCTKAEVLEYLRLNQIKAQEVTLAKRSTPPSQIEALDPEAAGRADGGEPSGHRAAGEYLTGDTAIRPILEVAGYGPQLAALADDARAGTGAQRANRTRAGRARRARAAARGEDRSPTLGELRSARRFDAVRAARAAAKKTGQEDELELYPNSLGGGSSRPAR